MMLVKHYLHSHQQSHCRRRFTVIYLGPAGSPVGSHGIANCCDMYYADGMYKHISECDLLFTRTNTE